MCEWFEIKKKQQKIQNSKSNLNRNIIIIIIINYYVFFSLLFIIYIVDVLNNIIKIFKFLFVKINNNNNE